MTQTEFTALVVQYEKLIYTICYQLTQNHHTAQDLAQETFLSAYSHIDSCDPANYRPWLARIATNKAKDYLKSARTRYEAAYETLPEPPEENPDSPERLLLDQAGFEDVRKKIWALGEPYREPAVLFFLENLPPGEISRRLKRPEKTVYTQLSRAKQMLQSQLKGKEAHHDRESSK